MPDPDAPPPGVSPSPAFATTHWTVVLTAGAGAPDQSAAQVALAALCRSYWYPIYAFLRRDGHLPADAQDLTQEFFARVIGKQHLAGLERGPGRFRSFLLVTLKHFLSDERKRAQARKRGGGIAPISLDELDPEERYRVEPAASETPETLFERAWSHAVLHRSLQRLRDRYRTSERSRFLSVLEPLLVGLPSRSYQELGAELDLSEGALKVAAHRLRKEFGRILRDEVALTLEPDADVDAEIRRLIGTLGAASTSFDASAVPPAALP